MLIPKNRMDTFLKDNSPNETIGILLRTDQHLIFETHTLIIVPASWLVLFQALHAWNTQSC